MWQVAPHSHYPGKVDIAGRVHDLIHRDRLFRNVWKSHRATFAARSSLMWDFMMLALGAIFFAAGIGYAYACERL
jgi:hypothetical protein